MLNVESRVYKLVQKIKKSCTFSEARQYATTAQVLVEVKHEDGKISDAHKKELESCIKRELELVEKDIYNRQVDESLSIANASNKIVKIQGGGRSENNDKRIIRRRKKRSIS
ncbi:MAG: hypothetical protein ACI4F9_07725 [Lachnospiraceae bacterium]